MGNFAWCYREGELESRNYVGVAEFYSTRKVSGVCAETIVLFYS